MTCRPALTDIALDGDEGVLVSPLATMMATVLPVRLESCICGLLCRVESGCSVREAAGRPDPLRVALAVTEGHGKH